ncbi:uncharacterized protein LOC116267565 [Nymphaea colorata]|nr:uncharacterized protein LOC116267565 [Nymphaea colorata]
MERFAFVAELLVSLKDEDPTVVKRSIVSGTHLFCSALEEIALQFRQSGEAEKYFQELWLGISKFKDSVFCIFLKDGSVGTRLVAVKFVETFILLFLPETNGSDSQSTTQTREGKSQRFNISWLLGLYPVRNLDMLIQEADKQLHLLLDQLESPNLLPSSAIIALINCLAAIARKRPLYYNRILSALISFSPNFESDGSHVSSIQYSLRTAFLSFLKCTNVTMIASRDRLLGILRGMNAGEAADQVIRHIEKMTKNAERVGDSRYTKEEQLSSSGDFSRKRPIIHDNGRTLVPEEISTKQARIDPVQSSSGLAPDVGSTEGRAKSSSLGGDMTPVEQMIALIGALLAEGDRGAKSLEILISNFHPDLLADIVMANMKYLPKSPPLSGKPVVSSTTSQTSSVLHQVPPSSSAMFAQSSGFPSQTTALSTPNGTTLPILDVLPAASNLTDMKRDPRRDPRRLDPRRAAMPAGSQSTVVMVEDSGGVQNGPKSFDLSATSRPYLLPVTTKSEDTIVSLACKAGAVASEESGPPAAVPGTNEISESLQESCDAENATAIHIPEDKDTTSEPLDLEEQSSISVEAATSETIDAGSAHESDQYSSAVSSSTTSEDTNSNLVIPPFLELSNEDQESIVKSAVTRIIEAYDHIRAAGGSHVRLALLARLVAEIDANNSIVMMLQRHVVADYQHQKGHDLSMHILYHLHAAMVSQSGGCYFSYYETIYEQFLVSVVKDLRDNFPASDKSLSRLLGEAPALPNSALQLLEELCHPEPVEHNGHETYNVEVERVTQGLGALWSLILGRPLVRQSCLDIVLKSAVHAQDDVRAKAIRLVANKLYHLSYLSEKIEQFATNMLLSVVDGELSPNTDVDQRTRANYENHETSTGGSQSSEPGATDSDSIKGDTKFADNAQQLSSSQAQRCMSLYFALCTKKPSLLQLVFSVYGRSQKAVKQVIHRHIPILVRNIGSSYSELLHIISEPPHGSENLLILVLQTLTAECTPAPDLIATVKQLYETKLKDAAILIPILSLLSKDEVLPIFPKLVDLPLEKFKNALDYILQGSAHTGPALTPVEVLVAIHGINPEKEGIALKKITEACTACFVQRTVFTQQVLAKALNQLVEQIPLPLLFMRTVIQAIDAFPALVDFVMGILSRLISKQIWQMPKLWVGFLKCAYQTQPHSFNVLLQLPAPQLESALNKHTSLRVPLAAYANQPSIRTSLPRSTLAVLGLVNEKLPPTFMQVSASQSSETCSSVQSTTPT